MEAGFGFYSRRSSPPESSSSSETPPPPASPIAGARSLPFRWGDDRLFGCNPNADSLRQTSSFANPNYYSAEALQSDFSGLSLFDGKALHLPPYDLDAGATGGLDANTVRRLMEMYARSIVYSDRDKTRFDASRSALPRILDDQGTDPYFFSNQGVDFHASSSSSLSGNLISRDLLGCSSTLLGAEMANRRLQGRSPCGLFGCNCQYNSSPFQSYLQPQNVLNGARAYSNGFTDYGMNNRRSSRPNLEIDTSSVNLTLLRGRLVSCAKDHYDCRILKAKIQDAKEEEIEMVLDEVIDDASDLMTHHYGTHFMQKLIEVCSEEQRSRLLLSVMKDNHRFIRIFCSNGSRCVQSLLENLKSPLLITKFMLAIRPGVVALIKDSNGYHVIKCCLHFFSAQQNKYILKAVVENCFDLATDTYGCRVIYQCFDISEGEDKEQLLSKIIEWALPLAKDCYGNYVVQYVLDLKNAEINSKIRKTLSGNFASLSFDKFGSHVVEKLLTRNDIYQSSPIINELLQSPDLLVHPFGNYVIKTALSVAQGDTLRALCNLIKENELFMLNNQYGRKVIESYKRKKVTAYTNMYYPQSAYMEDKVIPGFERALHDMIPGCCSTRDSYLDGVSLESS